MERKQFLLTGVMTGIAATGLATSLGMAAINKNAPLKPFYLPPDAEPLIPIHGLNIRIKVRSSQTNMQYSCIDAAVAPKTMGPPPHFHKDLDELMYVHEGMVHVLVGSEVYEVKAGGWHFRPRGIVHTFWNASDKPALFTDMYFNQNFEDYLEELFFKIYPDMMQRNLNPGHPEIAKKIGELDKKFGLTHFPENRQSIVDKYGLKN